MIYSKIRNKFWLVLVIMLSGCAGQDDLSKLQKMGVEPHQGTSNCKFYRVSCSLVCDVETQWQLFSIYAIDPGKCDRIKNPARYAEPDPENEWYSS